MWGGYSRRIRLPRTGLQPTVAAKKEQLVPLNAKRPKHADRLIALDFLPGENDAAEHNHRSLEGLKLDSHAQLDLARLVVLAAKHAEIALAVKVQTGKVEKGMVERIQQVSGKDELVTFGRRDILAYFKVPLPVNGITHGAIRDLGVLTQQRPAKVLVDGYGIREEVETESPSPNPTAALYIGVGTAAGTRQVKAIRGYGAGPETVRGSVIAVRTDTNRQARRERPDTRPVPAAKETVENGVAEAAPVALAERQRIGVPRRDHVSVVERLVGIIEVRIIRAVKRSRILLLVSLDA